MRPEHVNLTRLSFPTHDHDHDHDHNLARNRLPKSDLYVTNSILSIFSVGLSEAQQKWSLLVSKKLLAAMSANAASTLSGDGPDKNDVQSSNASDYVTAAVPRLDIGGDADSKVEPSVQSWPVSAILVCKCGMPLCICEAPAPSVNTAPMQSKSTSTSVSVPQSNPRPKKAETSKTKPSTSNSRPGSVFNLGQANNGFSDNNQMDYEVNGEGMREAIKNGDVAAVKKLLSEGVNSNYHDKQGLSLLHLAAVFNQTEIAFALMDSGASLDYKNAQGETPLDCAPVTLQFKMREKMEEDRRV